MVTQVEDADSQFPPFWLLTHRGQFPFLILGHWAVFASEVTAPKAQCAGAGV
jgi:hypothetical protein